MDPVDQLVADITKPMYVLRMNHSQQGDLRREAKTPKERAARTAVRNARAQIHEVVTKYAAR